MKYGFLVKNYSSMDKDKGRDYKTEYIELDTEKEEDRKYYGIKQGQSLDTVKKNYKRFWGSDVTVVNTEKYKNHRPVLSERQSQPQRPAILGNSSFGFNTQSRSKRPSILNMSMPKILRRR